MLESADTPKTGEAQHERFIDNVPVELRRDRPYEIGGVATDSFGIVCIEGFWEGNEDLLQWLDHFIKERQPDRNYRETQMDRKARNPKFQNRSRLIELIQQTGLMLQEIVTKRYASDNLTSRAHHAHRDPEQYYMNPYTGEVDESKGILIIPTFGVAALTVWLPENENPDGLAPIIGDVCPGDAVGFRADSLHKISPPRAGVDSAQGPGSNEPAQRRVAIALSYDSKTEMELAALDMLLRTHAAPDTPY